MRLVIQRSKHASVTVENQTVGMIDFGVVVLVGFTIGDTEEDIQYCIRKLLNLRIFEDEKGVMNRSILEAKGSVLSISQFTLYGDTSHGNRPSYEKALPFAQAKILFDSFNQQLQEKISVATGVFGADQEVMITNYGPVTILLESRKEHDQK